MSEEDEVLGGDGTATPEYWEALRKWMASLPPVTEDASIEDPEPFI